MYHQNQGNNMFSSRMRHLFLQGGNIPGDSGLLLSTDAKPRLKWTPELHGRFIEAVNQLGGADKATPKTVMRVMGVQGLTLYHLKSHLQKYRLSKNLQAQANIGTAKNTDMISEGGGSLMSNTNIGSQTNKTMQISEALQMQIEVQRRLHEQLEVQRHLQLRIEAQGKYLQTVLEKAQETLGKQNLGSAGLEAAKVQLSDLVSKVSNECLSTAFTGLEEFPGLHAHTAQLADCSMDSCLTSCEGSQKDQEIHNVSMGLGTCHGSSPLCTQHTGEDFKIEQLQFTWCGDMNKHKIFASSLVKESERTGHQVQRDPSILSMSIKAQKERGGSSTVSETLRKERDEHWQLEQPNSKRPAAQQEREKQSNGFELPGLTARLDLNADDDAAPSGKQFDLNGFSWS